MSHLVSTIGVVSNEKQPNKQSTYYSYLLRLRWVDNANQPAWRISLEEPGNKAKLQFDSLTAMCAYLANQLGLDKETESETNNRD